MLQVGPKASIFAASSAAALPCETNDPSDLWARHFTTANFDGSVIACKRSAIACSWEIGDPSVRKNPLCAHIVPKTCITPYPYDESVYMVHLFPAPRLQAAVNALISAS